MMMKKEVQNLSKLFVVAEPEQIVCGGTETGKSSPAIKTLVLCCLACPTSMTDIVHSQRTPN